MNLRCHCCHAMVMKENPVHRGILINNIAAVSARITSLSEQVKVLRSKRWSKQFQKQRDLDVKRMVMMLEELSSARDELRTLQVANRELYNG